MKKIEAVIILKEQQKNLSKVTGDNYSVWTTNTLSWIKLFFGESSEEYIHLKGFRFWEYDDRNPEGEVRRKASMAHTFLENCIFKIEKVGLAKKEWKHILINTHPAIFWSLFTSLLIFSFWLGKITTNESNNAATEQPAHKNNSSDHNKKVYLEDTTKLDSTKK